MNENNMATFENNMPSLKFEQIPAFASEIKLPLGTAYNTGLIQNTDAAESKVLIGILGELERLIFELKERVLKIEGAQDVLVDSVNASLERIENIFQKAKT